MLQRLTDKDYWDTGRSGFRPYKVRGTPFDSVLNRLLPEGDTLRAAEIGAYPGGFLLALSRRFKWKPTAIDYSEHCADIARLFEFNECPAPEILNADFFEIEGRTFDVVCSFGFVEHFNDPGTIIARHVEMMTDHGYLVLSVPYLGGFQGLVRRLAYTDDQIRLIWSSHNTAIMSRSALHDAVASHGLEVLFCDYAMQGKIWIDPDGVQVKENARWIVRLAKFLDRFVFNRFTSSRHWSPMVLLVAKKP